MKGNGRQAGDLSFLVLLLVIGLARELRASARARPPLAGLAPFFACRLAAAGV